MGKQRTHLRFVFAEGMAAAGGEKLKSGNEEPTRPLLVPKGSQPHIPFLPRTCPATHTGQMNSRLQGETLILQSQGQGSSQRLGRSFSSWDSPSSSLLPPRFPTSVHRRMPSDGLSELGVQPHLLHKTLHSVLGKWPQASPWMPLLPGTSSPLTHRR